MDRVHIQKSKIAETLFGASAAGWSPGSDDGRLERENMKTTIEYYGMKKEELQETVNEYGYTKEECKLLDESENTRFYDILALLEDSKEYYKSMGYNIGETIAMSDGRFALLLNY